MVLGLKRGIVALADHDPEWEQIARETIGRLWRVFGSVARDIQHVGSTAIVHIKAKPIIDIAVGVQNLDSLKDVFPRLEAEGFYKSVQHAVPNDILYALGDSEDISRTHHIHIVEMDGLQWRNYINLRDYLNDCPQKALEYEKVKIGFAELYLKDRSAYTKGKDAFFEDFLLEARLYAEIKKRVCIKGLEPLTKGWSSDKKYIVHAADDKRLLLRIADIAEYDRKKAEYELMQQAAALDIPMQQPIEFGICDNGKSVFTLLTWVDGEDAQKILPLLSETEQYVLGLKAGEILRKIHSLPMPENSEEWETHYNRKLDRRITKYRESGLHFDGDENVISYIENNRHLLQNRPQVRQHGDYHAGNMIVDNKRNLYIIDFNRFDIGDPWEEFSSIYWTVDCSPHFATGQIIGYFEGDVPQQFMELLCFYNISCLPSNLTWSIPFGQQAINDSVVQNANTLSWYENFQNNMPKWFIKDFYIQWIDGIPYKLKSPFDFSFLRKYGKVFKVLDDQDSGNICFSVDNGDKRYFIKFAGAPTDRACVSVEEAVSNLKCTVPIYRDLAHPNLVNLISTDVIGGGFAMVFDWVDGECPHPMYPMSRKRFLQISMKARIKIFEDILSFHAHVISKGYIAIDFYDGSILYDLENDKTAICDIDFYSKAPYINQMGRLWGSSRFMSPEEFTLGAEIDEITNVYGMGATAFCLFADSDRSHEKWPLNERLYNVVKKAVSNERDERQQSIRQLIDEWRAAKI